ncbi:MAG: M13 family metallopeptidase [Bdellovibrionaceae bacterium]|nr:M13 family metallopeptidase [Pseudobdellovibrionaceae bacterium]
MLNQEIEPCQNFYQHVCSKEIQSFERPLHRSRYTFYFADAYEDFLLKVKSYLTQPSQGEPSFKSEQVRNFFAACMDKPTRIKEEQQVTKLLLKSFEELTTRRNVLKYASESLRDGDLDWFSFENSAFLSEPKKWRLQIHVNWTTLPEKSYYQDKEVLKDLTLILTDLLKIMKLDSAAERARRIVDFEVKISTKMPTVEEFSSLWNQEKYWSQHEFIKKFPRISNQLGINRFPKDIPIHQYTVTFYQWTEKMLEEADLQVLKDFLLVRLLLPKLDFSQPEWSAQYWSFKSKRLGGPAQRRPLDQECARLVLKNLGLQLGAEMTKSFFKDYPRKDFTDLVESLRSSLVERINENQWLSSKGRDKALKKVKSLRMALLYPERDEDWRFPPLARLDSNHFLNDLKLIDQANDKKILDEIRRPRNLNAWSKSPLDFDAYYLWAENRFYFPAAFAMKPIFDVNRKKIENLGGIGTLIAHELGHALDKYGSQYDESGVKKSIFGKKDRSRFERFGKGFIDQFDRIGHNGEQTLAENLADHVGLVTAFHAAFAEKKDPEQQKVFFISYARLWCTSMSDGYRVAHLKEDSHALPEARVNEQLKHLAAFAETFQCDSESPMVLPEKERARVW